MVGRYPVEYNARVHGPFVPGRYYGKPDLHISEVKLGELSDWIGRRKISPGSMFQAIGRTQWRWLQKWVLVKKTTFAPFAQALMGASLIYYYGYYHAMIKYEKHAKYH